MEREERRSRVSKRFERARLLSICFKTHLESRSVTQSRVRIVWKIGNDWYDGVIGCSISILSIRRVSTATEEGWTSVQTSIHECVLAWNLWDGNVAELASLGTSVSLDQRGSIRPISNVGCEGELNDECKLQERRSSREERKRENSPLLSIARMKSRFLAGCRSGQRGTF